MKKILIIDDDEIILIMLSSLLRKSGYEPMTASDGESGLVMAKNRKPDLVITDYSMPGISGLDVVQDLSRSNPGLPVIMLTAHGDVSLTIKSIQAGVYDFIEKPINPKELIETIKNGIQVSNQSKSLSEAISFTARKVIEDNLLAGKTPVMREIFKNIGRISLNKMNVLITGETGTGKEQVARLIHYSGVTRDHPLVVVNCNAATEEQLSHELFGFGDQDNSRKSKKGKLEQAGEGSIYIDELSNLSFNLQSRLLRVLQEMTLIKPGNEAPVPINARIIASSSKNLEEMAESGEILKELYYQLKVFNIVLPPIRDRLDDIPELTTHILNKLNRKLNKNIVKLEDGLMDLLKSYDWPGNVRELENVLTQAVILSRSDVLEKSHIHLNIKEKTSDQKKKKYLVSMMEVEKEHILQVLNILDWNKQEAAKILDITRPTLNTKIEKYRLQKD
jgi:DNA-binding NtrC family response regulator